MEFYGSEGTILTEAKPRSIFLQKTIKPILPDIIGQYLLYYIINVYDSSTSLYLMRLIITDNQHKHVLAFILTVIAMILIYCFMYNFICCFLLLV